MIKEYVKYRLKKTMARIIEAKKAGAEDLAFIGIACFIGTLSKFRYGDQKGKDHCFWTAFVMEYFDSKYTKFADLLYDSYRCALVHAFSTTGNSDPRRIELTSGDNRRKFHLLERDSWVPIHIDILFDDTITAYEKYFGELASSTVDAKKVKIFTDHFLVSGILGPSPIDIL